MGKTVLVILAEGAEEMEAVIVIDTLRRGGVDVIVAGLHGKEPIKCSRMVVILPDTSLDEVAKDVFDAVILPGGLKGAEALAQSPVVGDILKKHESRNSVIAAICAAPMAFKSHGIASGKRITSYPSFKEKLVESFEYCEDRVVIDGNVVTSRGPGTAFEFALALVSILVDDDKSKSLVDQMLLKL